MGRRCVTTSPFRVGRLHRLVVGWRRGDGLSLQRPKKVCIRGSDGGEFNFLCKPKDDLRKDARVIEVLTAANRMLHKSSNCRRRKLRVKCYAVVPLDQECGLIEWVPNMEQIRTIVKTYWEAYKHPFNVGQIRNRHAAVMAHQTDRKGQLSVDPTANGRVAAGPSLLV